MDLGVLTVPLGDESIEDSLTSSREGLEKAVDVLSRAVFETRPGDAYRAE